MGEREHMRKIFGFNPSMSLRADTYTAQGAENKGRANPAMENPYTPGTTDWHAFAYGQSVSELKI